MNLEKCITTFNATFNLYSIKEWRYNLFEIFDYALSNYCDQIELETTKIYVVLTATIDAAHYVKELAVKQSIKV